MAPSSRSGIVRVGVVTTAAPPSPNGQARSRSNSSARCSCDPDLYDRSDAHSGGRRRTLRTLLRAVVSPVQPDHTGLGQSVAWHQPERGLVRTILTRADEIRTALRHDPVVIAAVEIPSILLRHIFASRFLRLPFAAYLFDDPVYQWEEGNYRRLARIAERIWSRGATAVIVPNEVLAGDVQSRLPHAKIHIVPVIWSRHLTRWMASLHLAFTQRNCCLIWRRRS
jgi:hypothetical protein